jgi:hypothetical protein
VTTTWLTPELVVYYGQLIQGLEMKHNNEYPQIRQFCSGTEVRGGVVG